MKKSKTVLLLVAAVLIVLLGFAAWDLSVLFNGGLADSGQANFDLREQVLPYLRGSDADSGDPVAVAGSPQAVVVKDGKLAIKFFDSLNGRWLYADPLAIRSKPWGEHPADKVLRLKRQYGLRMSRILEFMLRHERLRDGLCRQLSFDYWYQPGFGYRGVVAEVDITGTALVVMNPIPWDWRPRGSNHLAPSFFIVSCDSNDQEMVNLWETIGFDPDPTVFGATFAEQIQGIFDHYHGGGLATDYRLTEMLKEIGLGVGEEIRLVGRFVRLNGVTFFTGTDAFAASTVGKLYRLHPDGAVTELYRTPGEILFAMPNPHSPGKWFISSEGFEKSDPRFQSMFEVDVRTGRWRVVDFPLPEDEELFVSSGRYSPDGRFLFVKRYGFVWQGGGIWVLDLTDPSYPKRQLVTWDHMLSWVPLGGFLVRGLPSEKPSEGVFPMLITAKEVDEDLAMTVSRAVFKLDGMNSKIVGVKRLGEVVGWSPAAFRVEKLAEGRYRFYIGATFGYKCYMKSVPFAIYVVDLYTIGFP